MPVMKMSLKLLGVYGVLAMLVWLMYISGMAYGASGWVQSAYGAFLFFAAAIGFVAIPFVAHLVCALLSWLIFSTPSYGHFFGALAALFILVPAIFQTFAV